MKKEITYNNEKYLIDFMPSAFCSGYASLHISKRKNFLGFGYWSKIIEHIVLIKNFDENPVDIAIELIKEKKEKDFKEEEYKKKLNEWFK